MSATLIVGTKKGLLRVEKGSRAWRTKPIKLEGIPVSYAFHDGRTGTLYAALDHGHWGCKLQKSTDGGETFTELTAPKYPESALPTPCTKKPAALRYIYVLAPGRKEEPKRLYAGTVPGGLFVSEDAGASFKLDEALWSHRTRNEWGQAGKDFDEPGTHSIVVDPRDPRHLIIGNSSAGVMETKDGGRSWEPRNKGLVNPYAPTKEPEVGFDPHFVVASPSEPDVLWQQNHFGVFRSTDGAKTWVEIGQQGKGPVHFGFAIAVDAKNAQRAWVVPATSDDKRYAVNGALGVGRTDDGGKSWTVFREGLPQENCYDVVYRHGLDVSGDLLAFGSTTGNLYVSENRGESWHCVGTSFPPINSVRFA